MTIKTIISAAFVAAPATFAIAQAAAMQSVWQAARLDAAPPVGATFAREPHPAVATLLEKQCPKPSFAEFISITKSSVAQGPFIALTPGSRRSYAELVGLSQAIAAHGYRVLLHDRRNCGASDVAFDGSGSEHEVWADDLYALAKQLDAAPLYVGGSSAGARLAILFAIRHPDALRGLLLWRVTGGQEAVDRLAENYYGQFMKLARAGGMQAVADSEHFRECIAARPSNRERIMATDVE